ncbi:MAG: hypothetical protein WBV82_06045 [Myxococcaceae bacterium]
MQLARLFLALWLIVAGFAGSVDLCGTVVDAGISSPFAVLDLADAEGDCDDDRCTDCFDGCADCACCALRQSVVPVSFAISQAGPAPIRAGASAPGVALTGSTQDVFLPPRA